MPCVPCSSSVLEVVIFPLKAVKRGSALCDLIVAVCQRLTHRQQLYAPPQFYWGDRETKSHLGR
jgi:hypothetical protein